LVFGLRYRHSIPHAFKRAVGTGVLPVILINLVIGFTIPAIDNSAHISGLLAGAALAALIPFQKPGEEEVSSFFKSIQIVLLALVVVCFYSVAKNYNGPNLSVRNLSRSFTLLNTSSTTQEFIDAINNAETAFRNSADDLQSGRTNHIASLKQGTTKSIDQLRKIPSLDPKLDQLTAALLRVMQDQYDLIESVERTGSVGFGQSLQLKENMKNYENVTNDISNWVDANGRRFGITNEKNR